MGSPHDAGRILHVFDDRIDRRRSAGGEALSMGDAQANDADAA
jgi:hypothetical protein